MSSREKQKTLTKQLIWTKKPTYFFSPTMALILSIWDLSLISSDADPCSSSRMASYFMDFSQISGSSSPKKPST